MAVSLVSTGVQFPDSTIQTTAAGASAVTLISTTTTTSSSTVDIAFSGSYTHYQVICTNVFSASNNANASPQMAYSTDSFATVSGWSDGIGWGVQLGSGSGWLAWDLQGGGTRWVTGNSTVPYTPGVMGNFMFPNAKSTTLYKFFQCVAGGANYYQSYQRKTTSTTTGYNTNNTNALTGVRFYMDTGNIRGSFTLYGIN